MKIPYPFFIPYFLIKVILYLVFILYNLYLNILHNLINFLYQIYILILFYLNEFIDQKCVNKVHLYNIHKNINLLVIYLVIIYYMLKKFHMPNILIHFKLYIHLHHLIYMVYQFLIPFLQLNHVFLYSI